MSSLQLEARGNPLLASIIVGIYRRLSSIFPLSGTKTFVTRLILSFCLLPFLSSNKQVFELLVCKLDPLFTRWSLQFT